MQYTLLLSDVCYEHLCLNNGTCSDTTGSAKCECPEDIYGDHCEDKGNSKEFF